MAGGNVAKGAHSADVRLLAPICLWFLFALSASAATGSHAQHDGKRIANQQQHLVTLVGGGAVSNWNAEMRSSGSIYNYRDIPQGNSPWSGANRYIRGSYPAQWRQHREDRATRRVLVQVGKPGLPRAPPSVHYR